MTNRWMLAISVYAFLIELVLGQTPQLYDLYNKVSLTNDSSIQSDRLKVYILKARKIPPYQEMVKEHIWLTPKVSHKAHIIHGENKNHFYEVEIFGLPPKKTIHIHMASQVKVLPVRFDLSKASWEKLPDGVLKHLKPEFHIQSDHRLIKNLARKLKEKHKTPKDLIRGVYDHVIQNTRYSGYSKTTMGALWCLNNKEGDCSEFTHLFIALCRACGLPAREFYGYTFRLTAQETIVHCWPEIYCPSKGWVPADPTHGRHAGAQDRFFCAMPGDRAILSRGPARSVLEGHYLYRYEYWPSNGLISSTFKTNIMAAPYQSPYEEEFDIIPNDWGEKIAKDREFKTIDGEFSLLVKNKDWMSWCWAPHPKYPASFEAELKGRVQKGPAKDGEYGILWGDNKNHYAFMVSMSGQYKLAKRADGKWVKAPAPWTDHKSINKGLKSNTLGVRVKGDLVTLRVNGEEIKTVKCESFGEKRIGLFAGTYATPPVCGLFDRFKVKGL